MYSTHQHKHHNHKINTHDLNQRTLPTSQVLQSFLKLLSPISGENQPRPIDLYNLRHLVFNSLPDSPSHLRPLVWRLLLGMISARQPKAWNQEIRERREEYRGLVNHFTQELIKPSPHSSPPDKSRPTTLIKHLPQIETDVHTTQSDLSFFNQTLSLPIEHLTAHKLQLFINHLHSLPSHTQQAHRPNPHLPTINSSPSPRTLNHDDDDHHEPITPVKPQLDRLASKHSHTLQPITISHSPPPPISVATPSFSFQAPSPVSTSPSLSPHAFDSSKTSPATLLFSFTYKHLLSRLLAIWSTLNPGIGYVRGMNQIGAVMIYVFSQSQQLPDQEEKREDEDQDEDDQSGLVDYEGIEADAFWAFTTLMTSLRDLFIQSPSASASITDSVVTRQILKGFERQLDWLDPQLFEHLRRYHQVDLQSIALVWTRNMFCRSMELPDSIRIWDSIIAINSDAQQLSMTSVHNSPLSSEENATIGFLLDISCTIVLKLSNSLQSIHRTRDLQRILEDLKSHIDDLQIDQLIQDSLFLRQRRLADGLNFQNLSNESDRTTSGAGQVYLDLAGDDGQDASWGRNHEHRHFNTLAELASGFSWPSASNEPSSTTKDESDDFDSATIGGSKASLLGKWISKAESWKDSDAALTLSKTATNWSVLASTWRPPSLLVSKLNPMSSGSTQEESENCGAAGAQGGRREKEYDCDRRLSTVTNESNQSSRLGRSSASSVSSVDSPSQSGSPSWMARWSRISNTSHHSAENSLSSLRISTTPRRAIDGSSTCSSSGNSPVHSTPSPSHHGAVKPLILSSRARTKVPSVTNQSIGSSSTIIQELVKSNTIVKRLSGISILGTPLAAPTMKSEESIEQEEEVVVVDPSHEKKGMLGVEDCYQEGDDDKKIEIGFGNGIRRLSRTEGIKKRNSNRKARSKSFLEEKTEVNNKMKHDRRSAGIYFGSEEEKTQRNSLPISMDSN